MTEPEKPEAAPLRLDSRLALRPKEAAKALGVSERTLRSLLPRLPHVRLEGAVLLPVEALQQWLRDHTRDEQGRADEGRDSGASSGRPAPLAVAREMLEGLRGRRRRGETTDGVRN